MLNVMVGIIFAVAGVAVLAPTLQRVFLAMPSTQQLQYLQAQAYLGLTDDRTLNATPTMKWINLISDPPYYPWITASFYNDGWVENGVLRKWSVFIGINNPDELTEIAYGESIDVNLSSAQRRMELIFYKCNPNEKASVRVIGKY